MMKRTVTMISAWMILFFLAVSCLAETNQGIISIYLNSTGDVTLAWQPQSNWLIQVQSCTTLSQSAWTGVSWANLTINLVSNDLYGTELRTGMVTQFYRLLEKKTGRFGVLAGSTLPPQAVDYVIDLGCGWVRMNNSLTGVSPNMKQYLDAGVNVVITFGNHDPVNCKTNYGLPSHWPSAGFPFISKQSYQDSVSNALMPVLPYLAANRDVWVQCENEITDASLNTNSKYWRGTTSQYIDQLAAFHEVVKTINPSIPVVLSSFPSETMDTLLNPSDTNYSYVSNRVSMMLTQGQYDAVDLHFYGDVRDIPSKIQVITNMMPSGKIWISTENGGPDYRCTNTPVHWDQNSNLFEQVQSIQVSNRLRACADNGGAICLWFSLFDLTNSGDVFCHLGLLDVTVSPPRKKNAYYSFKDFTSTNF